MLANGKIPITLGIIGHRDADFTAAHEKLITQLIDDLHLNFPNSPLVLFSQLAEGADSDVASLFLRKKNKYDSLVVPIPMHEKRYISTFDDNSHIETFSLLKSRADKFFELNPRDLDTSNELLFRQGGKFVADSSMILIFIWDQTESGAIGGSAELYYYKTNGGFEVDKSEVLFEKGSSVISLKCSRGKEKHDILVFPTEPLKEILKDLSISKALSKIEYLNRNSDHITKEEIRESEKNFLTEREILNDLDKQLMRYYTQTDVLAIKNQKKYFIEVKSLFLMGLLIISLFEYYKHLALTQMLLAMTFSMMILALLISKVSKRNKSHLNFLENRVLAEAIRIQFFWNLSGVQFNVADYILRIYKREYEWIKVILNAINGLTYHKVSIRTDTEFVAKHWIHGQSSYFSRKLKQTSANLRILNNISNWAFLIALAILASILGFHEQVHNYHLLHHLIVGTGIFLGIFALSKGYIEKRGFHQTKNQYILMHEIFVGALKRIKDIETASNKDYLIKQLYFLAGKEALIENGNWYVVFKDKEASVEGIGG